ncbi:MAG: hypothetical protein R3B68_00445 [Phycisphaerales bacterium]
MFWRVVKRMIASLGCFIFMGLGGAISLGFIPRSAVTINHYDRSKVKTIKSLILWGYDTLGPMGCGLAMGGIGLLLFIWAWASLAFPKDRY